MKYTASLLLLSGSLLLPTTFAQNSDSEVTASWEQQGICAYFYEKPGAWKSLAETCVKYCANNGGDGFSECDRSPYSGMDLPDGIDQSTIGKDDSGDVYVPCKCKCQDDTVEGIADAILDVVIEGLSKLDEIICGVFMTAMVSVVEVGIDLVPGGAEGTAAARGVEAVKSFTENALDVADSMGNWVGQVCGIDDPNWPNSIFDLLLAAPDSYGTSIGCKKKNKADCKKVDSVPDKKTKSPDDTISKVPDAVSSVPDAALTSAAAPAVTSDVAPAVTSDAVPLSTDAVPLSTDAVPLSTDAAAPISTDAAAPVSTDGAAPVSTDGAAPVSTDGAAPVSTDSAAPVSTDGAAPVSTDGAAPVSTDGAAPVSTDGAAPVSTDVSPVSTNVEQPTASVNPTASVDPSATPSIDPSATPSIDPSATNSVDPSITSSVDPSATSGTATTSSSSSTESCSGTGTQTAGSCEATSPCQITNPEPGGDAAMLDDAVDAVSDLTSILRLRGIDGYRSPRGLHRLSKRSVKSGKPCSSNANYKTWALASDDYPSNGELDASVEAWGYKKQNDKCDYEWLAGKTAIAGNDYDSEHVMEWQIVTDFFQKLQANGGKNYDHPDPNQAGTKTDFCTYWIESWSLNAGQEFAINGSAALSPWKHIAAAYPSKKNYKSEMIKLQNNINQRAKANLFTDSIPYVWTETTMKGYVKTNRDKVLERLRLLLGARTYLVDPKVIKIFKDQKERMGTMIDQLDKDMETHTRTTTTTTTDPVTGAVSTTTVSYTAWKKQDLLTQWNTYMNQKWTDATAKHKKVMDTFINSLDDEHCQSRAKKSAADQTFCTRLRKLQTAYSTVTAFSRPW